MKNFYNLLFFILTFTCGICQAALLRLRSLKLKPNSISKIMTPARYCTTSFGVAQKHMTSKNRQRTLFSKHEKLHQAIMQEDLSEASKLIKDGANVNQTTNFYKFNGQCGTPLHMAVFNLDIVSVQFLLNANADVNIPSEFGITPLDMAIWLDDENNNKITQLAIIRILIAAGAKTKYKPDSSL